MAMIKLPEKLSSLIEVALGDLEAAEASGTLKIDMSTWHSPEFDENGEFEYCSVCLAGSVIAGTLGLPEDMDILPESFQTWNQVRLNALDDLRTGYIAMAYREINDLGYWEPIPENLPEDMDIVQYSDDPAKFKEEMREMARIIAAAGF